MTDQLNAPDQDSKTPETITPAPRTRAEINRENAQKSTGPRTPEGKEAQRPLPAAPDKSSNSPQEPPAASPSCASSSRKASLNALRHGITAQVIIMTEEDIAAYKAFTAKYHVHFKPADLVEEQLVQTLADCQWRLNRYRAVENTILAIGFDKRSDMWIVDNPQTNGAFATADGPQLQNQGPRHPRHSAQRPLPVPPDQVEELTPKAASGESVLREFLKRAARLQAIQPDLRET